MTRLDLLAGLRESLTDRIDCERYRRFLSGCWIVRRYRLERGVAEHRQVALLDFDSSNELGENGVEDGEDGLSIEVA